MPADDPLALPRIAELLAALDRAQPGPRADALRREIEALMEAAQRSSGQPLRLPTAPDDPRILIIIQPDDDEDDRGRGRT